MNVLITGAGLIGTHLARRLVDSGDQVVLYDLVPNRDYIGKVVGPDKAHVVAADMRDLPALIQALNKFDTDTIVHTAGLIGKRVAENTYTGSTNNILGTINVLEAARLMGLRRIVYVSTFGVYDRSKIKDSVVREDAATGGHNLYTVTKLCSEHLVHGYAFHHNLDSIIIRPSGVFGRGHYVGGSTVGMVMRELAPKTEVQIVGASGTEGKQAPLDLSTSKAELGYTPQFPLKKALQDYMEALWSEGKIVA